MQPDLNLRLKLKALKNLLCLSQTSLYFLPPCVCGITRHFYDALLSCPMLIGSGNFYLQEKSVGEIPCYIIFKLLILKTSLWGPSSILGCVYFYHG